MQDLTQLHSRRDGSPFMNLLMCAPLLDSRGTLRYYIGAQIDVTGLVKDGTDLDAYQRMRQERETGEKTVKPTDEFQELSKMFNNAELDIVRKHGGNMHREQIDEQDDASTLHRGPRVLIQDQSTFDHIEEGHKLNPKVDGRLSGPYKHVSAILLRPRACADYCASIFSSALHLLSASSSRLPLYASRESFNRPSSTESAAVPGCAHQLATHLPTARVV
jgi:hypothetical protein